MAAPNQPSAVLGGLKDTVDGVRRLEVQWTPDTEGDEATSFEVEWSSDGSAWNSLEGGTIEDDRTSAFFFDTFADPTHARVRAVNADGSSSWVSTGSVAAVDALETPTVDPI